MTSRLNHIDPGDLGLLFAAAAFFLSLPGVILALGTIGPGKTVHLNGFMSLTFTGRLNVPLVLAYPFLNALCGMVAGFICAWLYNACARRFGGVRINLG